MGSDRTQGSSPKGVSKVAELALIPWPQQLTVAGGSLSLSGARLAVACSQADTLRLRDALSRFVAVLPTPPTYASATSNAPPEIWVRMHCAQAGARYPELGADESYRLEVVPGAIDIWAGTEWGVMNALSTLAQLVDRNAQLPCCSIEDAPRFAWRGLLVDVARHFISVSALRRTIDAMAACKLNVMHLHLTDDQGFRFPSARLPMVHEQQYSLEELRGLVEYASSRGVRLVPEIDLPGHATALLAAHPWLGSSRTENTRRFGVHEGCLDPSKEDVYAAVGDLLAEVADVFPDRYLHVGGDEVSPGWWTQSPEIVEFMQAHDIAGVRELQCYFVNRVAELVCSLGRIPMGWDEVLHEGLATGLVVQAWRGASARDRALNAGYSCVVSANYYLDLFFPADVYYGFDPQAPLAELLAQEDRLLDDQRLRHVAEGMRWTQQWREEPDLAAAADTDQGALLGGEACLWSELVTETLLDMRLWTRLPGIAERFWSADDVRDVGDFYRRLGPWLERLKVSAGVDVFADNGQWMTAAAVPDQWLGLVELLEPVKWYGRLLGEDALNARLAGREMPLARPYDVDSPLDRVIDGLFAESPMARDLVGVCERASAGDAAARLRIAQLAGDWSAIAAQRDCPEELAPSAARLGQVSAWLSTYLGGAAGAAATLAKLQALDLAQGEYVLALVPLLCDWLEREST